MAARCKVLVCGGSLAGIVDSNPAEDMGDCLSRVLYVRYSSLLWDDHWSRGILPRVVCQIVMVCPRWEGRDSLRAVAPLKNLLNSLKFVQLNVKVTVGFRNLSPLVVHDQTWLSSESVHCIHKRLCSRVLDFQKQESNVVSVRTVKAYKGVGR